MTRQSNETFDKLNVGLSAVVRDEIGEEPLTRQQIEGLSWMVCWLRDNGFQFTTGAAYQTESKDVMPIYLNVNGKRFAFIMDVAIEQLGNASVAAADMMARTYVVTLNKAAQEVEWRLQHLPRLILNDDRFHRYARVVDLAGNKKKVDQVVARIRAGG